MNPTFRLTNFHIYQYCLTYEMYLPTNSTFKTTAGQYLEAVESYFNAVHAIGSTFKDPHYLFILAKFVYRYRVLFPTDVKVRLVGIMTTRLQDLLCKYTAPDLESVGLKDFTLTLKRIEIEMKIIVIFAFFKLLLNEDHKVFVCTVYPVIETYHVYVLCARRRHVFKKSSSEIIVPFSSIAIATTSPCRLTAKNYLDSSQSICWQFCRDLSEQIAYRMDDLLRYDEFVDLLTTVVHCLEHMIIEGDAAKDLQRMRLLMDEYHIPPTSSSNFCVPCTVFARDLPETTEERMEYTHIKKELQAMATADLESRALAPKLGGQESVNEVKNFLENFKTMVDTDEEQVQLEMRTDQILQGKIQGTEVSVVGEMMDLHDQNAYKMTVPSSPPPFLNPRRIGVTTNRRDPESLELFLPKDLPNDILSALKTLQQKPDSIHAANIVTRRVMRSPELCTDGLLSYQLANPMRTLFCSNSVFTTLLLAHDNLGRHLYKIALEKYLAAYCMDQTQPITSLCLASFLMLFAAQPNKQNRNETFSKGLGFLAHYIHLRLLGEGSGLMRSESSVSGGAEIKSTGEIRYSCSTAQVLHEILERNKGTTFSDPDILDDILRAQEVFYNTGRAFGSTRLNHLAHLMYEKALKLHDEYPKLRHSKLNLTKEAAFNLMILYKRSGARDAALRVMQKYLCID